MNPTIWKMSGPFDPKKKPLCLIATGRAAIEVG